MERVEDTEATPEISILRQRRRPFVSDPGIRPDFQLTDLDLHDPTDRALVERQVESIPGTVAARLVPGFERAVDELHVLVTQDIVPKHIVRDVQSVLYTRFDISLDHRVISVVRISDDDPMASPATARSPRVALTRTSVTQHAREVEVHVTVTDADGDEHVGTATGDLSAQGQRNASGRAALHAVRNHLADGMMVTVAGVDVVLLGGSQVAVVVTEVRTDRHSLTTAGSAVVQRGEVDAVARALLDGLNRILEGDLPSGALA